MLEKKPHEHAALIHAWADGATIQVRNTAGFWQDVTHFAPSWTPTLEYRIKPEPKPDYSHLAFGYHRDVLNKVMLTFDGETGMLKAANFISGKNDDE